MDSAELCRPGVSALTMVHLLHEPGAQKHHSPSLYTAKGNWIHTQQVLSVFKCIFSSEQSLWEPNEYFGSEKETMNSLFTASLCFSCTNQAQSPPETTQFTWSSKSQAKGIYSHHHVLQLCRKGHTVPCSHRQDRGSNTASTVQLRSQSEKGNLPSQFVFLRLVTNVLDEPLHTFSCWPMPVWPGSWTEGFVPETSTRQQHK